MNHPVHYFEDRSPDQSLSLETLAKKLLAKINEPPERMNEDHWAVYCNDRLVKGWKPKLRPKSRLVFAARFAPPLSLEIAFEDKHIVVFDKPEGLPTQPTLKSYEDNLFFQARLFYLQEKKFPVGLPYVGLHHRLDRGTSGLVLMTKQRQANKEVSDLFKNRKITKEYEAIVEWGDGDLPSRWRQEDPIKRKTGQKKKFFFMVDPTGDSAISEFQVLEKKEGECFHVACFPKTGRTHQLRVHLSHKGHPILGDSVYGRKKSAPRLMLHAARLQFRFNGHDHEIRSKKTLKFQPLQADSQD